MRATTVTARWTGEKLDFIGANSREQSVTMGGRNVPPTHMLLMGLAGCMGMDVLSILHKKKQAVDAVEVTVTGYQPDEYPKPFLTIEIQFAVKGAAVDPKAVARSIELSEKKYCMVGQTLLQPVKLETSYEVIPA